MCVYKEDLALNGLISHKKTNTTNLLPSKK